MTLVPGVDRAIVQPIVHSASKNIELREEIMLGFISHIARIFNFIRSSGRQYRAVARDITEISMPAIR